MLRARVRASGLSRQASSSTTRVGTSGLHHLQHGLQRHGLQPHLGLAVQPGVDRDEVVLARDLQPVPGVEEQPDLGALEPLGEPGQRRQHGGVVEVGGLEDLEAEAAQGGRDGPGVVGRVGQGGGLGVGAVADDQRHPAPLGGGGGGRQAEGEERGEQRVEEETAGGVHGPTLWLRPLLHPPASAVERAALSHSYVGVTRSGTGIG
jgi:hypothetical protein